MCWCRSATPRSRMKSYAVTRTMGRAGAAPRNGRERPQCESACRHGLPPKRTWIVAWRQWCESHARAARKSVAWAPSRLAAVTVRHRGGLQVLVSLRHGQICVGQAIMPGESVLVPPGPEESGKVFQRKEYSQRCAAAFAVASVDPP